MTALKFALAVSEIRMEELRKKKIKEAERKCSQDCPRAKYKKIAKESHIPEYT